jgi:hypothetical protein
MLIETERFGTMIMDGCVRTDGPFFKKNMVMKMGFRRRKFGSYTTERCGRTEGPLFKYGDE